MDSGIEIANLPEFLAACRRAAAEAPALGRDGLAAAGVPIIEKTRALESVAMRTGALGSSYAVIIAAADAVLTSRSPYGGGAEWGSHGKWKGFNRYGPPGRFAWRSVQESTLQIAEILTSHLEPSLGLEGWARP